MNISYSFLQVGEEKFSQEGLFRGYAHGRVRTFFRAAGWYKRTPYVRYILWLGLFSGRSAETRETEKNRKRRDFDDL